MTVTEYREQKKEHTKQLANHTKDDLVDKLLFSYDTIKRLEAKLQNTSSNSDYAKCAHDFEPRKTWVHTCKKCGTIEIEKGHFT